MLLLALAGLHCAHAQEPVVEERYATVIGNARYAGAALSNTEHDARALARTLVRQGFKVDLILNADGARLRQAARDFAAVSSRPSTVSLFFFSGHGSQYRDRNWLLGVDGRYANDDASILDVQDLVSAPRGANSLRIVILDACRGYIRQPSQAAAAKGLVAMNAPRGTLIAFATAPGQEASGGTAEDGMSLYAKHLVREIDAVGTPIEQVFKTVRNGVARESAEAQVPWESSSLDREFFAVPAPVGALAAAPRDPRPALRPEDSLRLEALYESLLAMRSAPLERAAHAAKARALMLEFTGQSLTDPELLAASGIVLTVGAAVKPIPGFARSMLGAPAQGGMLIGAVTHGRTAHRLKIHEGDVVHHVNGMPVNTMDDVLRISDTLRRGQGLSARVLRNGIALDLHGYVEAASIDDLLLEAAVSNWRAGTTEGYARARTLLQPLAANSYGPANAALANLAGNGFLSNGIPDYAEMVKQAQLASDSNVLVGKLYLSAAAAFGTGMPRSDIRANELRQQAAAEGASWALAGLALSYLNGKGTAINFELGRTLAERAAAQGYFEGMLALAQIYHKGQGVPPDPGLARLWYERTLQTGNIHAAKVARAALAQLANVAPLP